MENFKKIIDTLVASGEKLTDRDIELMNAINKFINISDKDDILDMFWMLDYRTDIIKGQILKNKNPKQRNMIKHYTFVKEIIANLISELEGTACSVDKASSIIKIYFNEINELNNTVWYMPNKGTAKDWNELVESTLMLQYGKSDRFINAVNHIKNIYEEGDNNEN